MRNFYFVNHILINDIVGNLIKHGCKDNYNR